jgi:ribosome-binding factor A
MPGSMDRRFGGRRNSPSHPYRRSVRVNALLAEVLADAVERVIGEDDRLGLLTVTGVESDPDLRHASVYFSSLPPEVAEVLSEHRVALQRAIATGVRLKRTPTLRFLPDPAVAAGARVEDAIRRINRGDAPLR